MTGCGWRGLSGALAQVQRLFCTVRAFLQGKGRRPVTALGVWLALPATIGVFSQGLPDMIFPTTTRQTSLREFVMLMAALMSVVALSVDGMLPALGVMRIDLHVTQASDMQYVVLFLFLGLSAGQIIAGPAADHFGRKPVIFAGFFVFLIGCVVCAMAQSLSAMLIGRVIQGLGAAAPRVVSMAMVRDRYEGATLARVNSFVTTTFILVPMVAPVMGQGITWAFGWRAIFVFFACVGLASALWLLWRQAETLPLTQRQPLRFVGIARAFHECLRHPDSWPFVVAMGLMFSPLFAYLGNAQHIFGVLYGQPFWFPVLFGTLASSVGIASLVNAKVVTRWGPSKIVGVAMSVLCVVAVGFGALRWLWPEIDTLPVTFVWMAISFFSFGMLFGNLMALSLQPLGHLAGVASALMSTLSNLIATALGALIGHYVVHDISGMVWGTALCALAALWVTRGVRRNPTRSSPQSVN